MQLHKCHQCILYVRCTTPQYTKGVCFINRGGGTGKVVPVHAMEAHKGNGGITPLILNLGTRCRWIANFPIWPFYTQDIPPVPTAQGAGWGPRASPYNLESLWIKHLMIIFVTAFETKICNAQINCNVESNVNHCRIPEKTTSCIMHTRFVSCYCHYKNIVSLLPTHL